MAPTDDVATGPAQPPPPPPPPPPRPLPNVVVQYARVCLFLFVFTVLFVVPVLVGLYTMVVVVAVELTTCLKVLHAFARALFQYVAANALHAITSAALGLSAVIALLFAVGHGGFGADERARFADQ